MTSGGLRAVVRGTGNSPRTITPPPRRERVQCSRGRENRLYRQCQTRGYGTPPVVPPGNGGKRVAHGACDAEFHFGKKLGSTERYRSETQDGSDVERIAAAKITHNQRFAGMFLPQREEIVR